MFVTKGLRASILSAALALGLVACQQAEPVSDPVWTHEVSDIAADPAVRYGQLDNGMRYAILANDTPPATVAVRMVFDMGSLGEADDQRGLAHFIEHMAFNGSTQVPEGEMVPLLERHGLQFGPDTNAFTGRETVGYQLDLPENDADSIDTALFLMRETASELTLDIEAIDRERGVILSEERFRNTPIRRWNNALERFRLPETIVADRDAIGTVEVVETAPRERFVDFYENYYVPERAIVVVVGDIDVDAIEAKIQDRFGDWQQPESARGNPDLGRVAADRPFSVGYFYDPEVFTILTVDAIKPITARPDTAENRFRDNLANLGDAILSRRFATLINSGTSPLIQANAFHGSDYDLVDRASILAVGSPERWQDALSMVEQELRRALEHGFTQAELDEQMANLATLVQDSADQAETRDSSNLADAIWSSWRGDQVFSHPSSGLERFHAYADQVTVEAVNAAFRAQWDGGEPLIFVANSIEIEDAEGTIRDVWAQSAQAVVEAPVDEGPVSFAYTQFGDEGSIAEREEIADLGLVRMRLENGVGIIFKQTDFEAGSVNVRVNFGRGSLEPRRVPAVDAVTGSVFTASGLGEHSNDEISRVLAGRSVGTGFSVTNDSFRFSATTTPGDLGTQMQLLTAFFADPGWREEGLSQFRALAPEIRRNMYSSPSGILQADVSRMLRSGDQRFGFPDAEEVAGVTLDAMREFLDPALESAPIEITVVGDVDEADVMAVLLPTFGALPERAAEWPDYPEARQVAFPDPVAEPVILHHNGPDYQAMANIYWPTTDAMEPRHGRAVSLLRAVFDLKLTERLREEEGFTYSAFNSTSMSNVYPDYGYLWVGVDVRLENVAATYAAVEELAAELAAGGISEDEMLRARRPLLEQLEERFEDNGWWTAWLTQAYSKPERLDRIRSLVGDYESFTSEELVALAETYLRPETAWRVTILPQAENE